MGFLGARFLWLKFGPTPTPHTLTPQAMTTWVVFLVFVREKVITNENITFTYYAPRIGLPDSSKLTINYKKYWWHANFWHDVIVIFILFFWCCFVSFVEFSYWSKFNVNIITGSGVMTIPVYKWLTRNLEFRNTPVWVFPNSWRLGAVEKTKFATKVSNKMLLNAEKCHCYSFHRFWVIKGKPTGKGWGVYPPPPVSSFYFLSSKTYLLKYKKVFIVSSSWNTRNVFSGFPLPDT